MHEATDGGCCPKCPRRLAAQIDHPPYRTLDLTSSDRELTPLPGHIPQTMRMRLDRAQGPWDGLAPMGRGPGAPRLLPHLHPVCLGPQRMPQALLQRGALGLGHGAARGAGLGERLPGVGAISDLPQLCGRHLSQRAPTLHAMPQPCSPIGDTLPHLRLSGTAPSHITHQESAQTASAAPISPS